MAENADPTMAIVDARRDGPELRVPRVSLGNYSGYCSDKEEYMLNDQNIIEYMLNLKNHLPILVCPEGYYGDHCMEPCECKNDFFTCHPSEGCICRHGYTGIYKVYLKD